MGVWHLGNPSPHHPTQNAGPLPVMDSEPPVVPLFRGPSPAWPVYSRGSRSPLVRFSRLLIADCLDDHRVVGGFGSASSGRLTAGPSESQCESLRFRSSSAATSASLRSR